ncbi:RHS repeat-associated core domain-containing protein [Couchioplanes caeruleus]|uniref:RHS repeat-associated core domain-containing protein n=1 Tax=Couchioplanes caeruleus TaxID=56438 RepID=UPI0011601566|nr:RHS repeat-associated core domain-containing protein [Couchioplanes caeruleus]
MFRKRANAATALWRDTPAPWSRRLALALPVTLIASVAAAPTPQAFAAAKAAPAVQCPPSRPDESAALITARMCNGRVQIEGATSETVEAFALPSGQVEQIVSAAPVRVKQPDGKWAPVDLTLAKNADGTVSPKAQTSKLVLSGAESKEGSHPLAEVGTGARRVAMSWSGKLPDPTLDGDRATYPEALPGVDLVVQATRTGAETFFVVKSRAAAARVAKLTLPVTGAAVSSYRQDAAGNMVLLDKADKPLATVPAPEMWDARTEPTTGKPAKIRKIATKLAKRAAKAAKPKKAEDGAGAQITLTPDQGFLNDPATQYPVTIDPILDPVSTTFDTYVKQNDTVDRGGANDLQFGNLSGNVTRSFVHWDTTLLRGKLITQARAYFWNWWSPSCTPASWEIWSTDPADSDTRWTNQPAWKTKEATSTLTKGFNTTCNDAWVDIDAKTFFQRAADAGGSRGYMGIRATSETDGNAFKQFRSRNAADNSQVPYAVVSYNTIATVGTRSTTPASACATGTGRPYINSLTPTLKAVVSDAETSPVKANFEWYAAGGAKIGGATTATAASGSTLSAAVPAGAFTNNSSYSWRVQGSDGIGNSAWSTSCEFTIDTTVPTATPTVSSSTYPAGGSGGGPGTAGTFSFGANGTTDASAFLYGLDTNPPTTAVNATTLGGSASVSITPSTAGAHTLYVRSRDRAGNLSPVKSHAFTVSNVIGTTASPKTGDLSAGKVVLSSTGASTSTGATYQWRRAETDTWTNIPTADVTKTVGGAVTWPLATTGSGKFPDLNWNVENTVNTAEPGPAALDGPIQVRASFAGGSTGSTAPVRFALDRDRADAPSADMGPGSVNLLTGNLQVEAVDAQAAGGLSVGRTFNSRQPGGVDPLFGPGWVSSATVSTADTYRNLVVTGGLAQVGTPDGDSIDFTKKATTSTGATFDPVVGEEALRLEYLSSSDTYKLTASTGDITTFSRRTTDPAGLYTPSSAVAVGTGDTTAVSWEKASVDGTDVVRPTRVVAPAPTGVNCKDNPLTTRGCKVLTYAYSTATTATASAHGDYLGRIKQMSFTAYSPATGAMNSVVLARYSYDNTGRLREAWDPRLDYNDLDGLSHQATGYAYDADGILSTITPPGQQPWQLSYTTVPGDAGKGRLNSVSRSALAAGTAVTSVVYGVPVTGVNAPADLSVAQTERWGQTIAPVDATAVFPPTHVPDGNQSTGQLPSSWRQASVTYLDGNAREVNTLQPGPHITSTWYDIYGNVIQELTARNRQRALDASPSDNAAAEAALATAFSSTTRYSNDGQRITDTIGPEHDVVLSNWTTVRGRSHTAFKYDEGAPNSGERYDLVTTETASVQYWASPGTIADADPRTTTYQYDWNLRRVTAQTVDPQGLALTTRTSYDDASGLVTATTTPAGDGTTAATRTTVHYRAGTGSGFSQCDNRPEWSGLPCRTGPGAQPGTDPELPTTTTTYTMYEQPAVISENNSSTTLRTTRIEYDEAGRPTEVKITAQSSLGTPVETRRSVYAPATGDQIRTEMLDPSGRVTAKLVRTFDEVGRQTSYTDADGATSTVTYDIASRPHTLNDGKAVRTMGYDDSAQGSGMPTQLSDSQAGTFSGSYNADGELVSETRPDGLTINNHYNEEGRRTGVEYMRGATSMYYDWVGVQAHGQWKWTSSTFSTSGLDYDAAGRLVHSSNRAGSPECTTRNYGFDRASNRETLKTYGAALDGECQTNDPASSRTWAHDTADRSSNSGYAYDNLGRTLTLPDDDTAAGDGAGDVQMDYYANDMTRAITTGSVSTTYTLDVNAKRFRNYTTQVGTVSSAKTNHYSDDTDNPTWIAENGSYTRMVTGLGGVAAVYDGATGKMHWKIANLHGDFVATIVGGDTGITASHLADEYGRESNAGAGAGRYGWLGTFQRSADNPAGLITMGVRTYNPVTGRFLSTDPIYGGNANSYDYCAGDPINCTDTSGAVSCKKTYSKTTRSWLFRIPIKWEWKITCNFSSQEVKDVASGTEGGGMWYAVYLAWKKTIGRAVLAAMVTQSIGWTLEWAYGRFCKKQQGVWIRYYAWAGITGFIPFGYWLDGIGCR